MTIIKKYRYGFSAPGGGDDQINCMISIDVAGLDLKPSGRRHNPNKLLPGGGKVKLNPVVSLVGIVAAGLNAG